MMSSTTVLQPAAGDSPAAALRRGVLFLAPLGAEAATARYRCRHLAEGLQSRGVRAAVVAVREVDSVRIDHDIVVLHRLRWDRPGAAIAAAARRAGAVVVYGIDDLTFSPDYAFQVGMAHPNDPARYHYHQGESADALRALTQADAVLTSTEFLASLIAQETDKGVPTAIVRNFLNDELLQLSEKARRRRQAVPRQDDRVVLGYLSGSPTHDGDLADIAAPLAACLRRFPQARLLVVGTVTLPSVLEEFVGEGRIKRHPFVPWRALPDLLATVDVNLAPLDPTRAFNHAKSEIKFLEAAAAGVPTIAGWAAGFAEGVAAVTSSGQESPCVQAATLADWERALAELIADPEQRRALGERARACVVTSAGPAAHTDALYETFVRLAALRDHAPATMSSVTLPLQTWRERAVQAARTTEAGWMRRWLRLRRHWRLLAEEQEAAG